MAGKQLKSLFFFIQINLYLMCHMLVKVRAGTLFGQRFSDIVGGTLLGHRRGRDGRQSLAKRLKLDRYTRFGYPIHNLALIYLCTWLLVSTLFLNSTHNRTRTIIAIVHRRGEIIIQVQPISNMLQHFQIMLFDLYTI